MSPEQVFSISLCGVFYFPWHRHQIEGTNSFYCLFRKTQAKWGKRNCPSFETAEVILNPGPFNRKVRCSTTGGFEPRIPRLTVRYSTMRPLRPNGNNGKLQCVTSYITKAKYITCNTGKLQLVTSHITRVNYYFLHYM